MQGNSGMEIGYRVIRPSDVGLIPLQFVQISLWRRADWGVAEGEEAVQQALETAALCRQQGIRTVFHPLEYPLTGEHAEETMAVLRRLAAAADLGIILHDEGGASGGRLSNGQAKEYEANVRGIAWLCPVSIENAFDSRDAVWFWKRFVVSGPEPVSITVDIGHLESAGIDSASFVQELPQDILRRIRFVHLHHNGEERYGVTDHRPLVPGCRELEALRAILMLKKDLWVILELDAGDRKGVQQSIDLVRELPS